MTAIAVVVVSVGGRGAAATSVMSEVTSVIFEVTFEAISVMTFEATSDAIVVAKATAVLAAEATADATVLAWRVTAVTRATSDAMAAAKASAAAKTPRTRQRRTGTATPLAFRSRPAGWKSSR